MIKEFLYRSVRQFGRHNHLMMNIRVFTSFHHMKHHTSLFGQHYYPGANHEQHPPLFFMTTDFAALEKQHC